MKYRDTPYFTCPNCSCWHQSPMPPKIWHAAHEGDPAAMSDADKRANEAVAEWLFKDWLRSKPLSWTLDIGCAFPWLAHSLTNLGCNAWATDAELHEFPGIACSTIAGDFEHPDWDLEDNSFSLISAVHTFEHFYDPLAALRKMRRFIKPDGFVFIRSPDHTVAGIERDLTPGHYQIHPFVHCLDSILQCLVELGDAFEVAWTSPLEPGQRDIVLRPITKRPTLGLAMIVKNEARDLPRCLDSISPILDAAVVMDTGSTDDTKRIAKDRFHSECLRRRISDDPSNIPTDIDFLVDNCSVGLERDAAGNWALWDFAKARNWSLEAVEAYRPAWITWADGDDELLTPEAYRRAMYRGDVDTFAVTIDSGGHQWAHQRLWRASKKVRFKGRVHEFPVIDGLRSEWLPAVIRHHQDADASQEDSNARNLRILMREWEEGPNERTAFYIANTHRDGGRWNDAVEWYRKRMQYGPNVFRDEYLFAWLYMARAMANDGNTFGADVQLGSAIAEAPDWCEFSMQRARIGYGAKDYKVTIALAFPCVDAPIPPTTLWRERSDYTDGPCRLISWCYEHLGKIGKAMQWAVLAQDRIGKPDAEWDDRVAKLKAAIIINQKSLARSDFEQAPFYPKGVSATGQDSKAGLAPAIVTRRKERIALVRPGAIGDVLMTLNLLPAFKEANPDAEIRYYTKVDGLADIISAAGAIPYSLLDVPGKECDRTIHLVGYPLSEGYPEKPMRQHLLHYFADELGLPVINKDMIGCYAMEMHRSPAGLPSLELPLPARPIGRLTGVERYATIQPYAGWSKYKNWSYDNWMKFCKALEDKIPMMQISLPKEPMIGGRINTPLVESLSDAVSWIANARMHIGVDSFANHLTNYFWKSGNKSRRVPGVILWGSTQMEAAGYPTNINIGHRLPCGPCYRENPAISKMPRGPCVTPPRATYEDDTPHECMRLITVDEVVASALKLWEESA